VISCGVAGDSFERVDAADSDAEFFGAELLGRIGVPASDLALLSQLLRTLLVLLGELKRASLQHEVACCEDERSGSPRSRL
jgi:hypothetical protein